MNPRRIACCGAVCGCLILGGTIGCVGQSGDSPSGEPSRAVLLRDGEVSAESLIDHLKSPDEAVRLQTIDKLGALGPKAAAAVDPLTGLLKDDSAKVRAHAARALGEIGAAANPAVAAMAELLKDSDETVRRQTVKSLMTIRPGQKVLMPLVGKLLEDSDPGVRMRVLGAIAEAGPRAVPGLIEALKDDKAANDYWALLVLREIGPAAKPAIPVLVKMLKDHRPEVRREVILTLATVDAAPSVSAGAIAGLLKDEQVAVAATFAMGRINEIPAEAEATIRENINSKDPMLSTVSVWALARFHLEDKQLRREATVQLIERLKNKDAFVRVAAARALASLPPAPKLTGPIWEKAFQNADETTVLHALDALAALGPAAVPRLTEALKYEKAQWHAAYILGQIGPAAASAADALAKLIDDKDDRTAHEAILALASIGPRAKQAVPALTKALQQDENPNAHAIAYALGRIGPAAAEAKPALEKLIASSDGNLALTSAWALTQIDPTSTDLAGKTLPVLTAGLNNPLPVARQGAAEGLGNLGSAAKDSLPALRRLLDDKDETVRAAAKKAIKAIRRDAAQ
jgi:HEAT repeat protein